MLGLKLLPQCRTTIFLLILFQKRTKNERMFLATVLFIFHVYVDSPHLHCCAGTDVMQKLSLPSLQGKLLPPSNKNTKLTWFLSFSNPQDFQNDLFHSTQHSALKSPETGRNPDCIRKKNLVLEIFSSCYTFPSLLVSPGEHQHTEMLWEAVAVYIYICFPTNLIT